MEKKVWDALLSDVGGLIRIPSVSSDHEQVKCALDYLLDVGKRLGFHTESLLDGQVGIIEAGEGEETLGILVHVDVVDVGDPKRWKHSPFKLTEDDGKLYGRGILDDKGPAMTVLYALKSVVDSGKPLHKKVRMIIGTQEEVEWTDMNAYTAEYEGPDYGFTPDGYFPIGNIEKGFLDLTVLFPAEKGLPDTPRDEIPSIRAMEGGVASNVVPAFCDIHLTNGIVHRADGRAAHTCDPTQGLNAITLMNRYVNSPFMEEVIPNSYTRILGLLDEYFGDSCYGEKLDLEQKSEYYQGEFIHRNVFTPSVMRTTEEGVEVTINIRFAYTTTREELVHAIEKMIAPLDGKIIGEEYLPAVFVSREKPFLKVLAESYEKASGMKSKFTIDYGASYVKAMKNLVSFGPIFPDMEDTCHENDEYISVENFKMLYEIYRQAIGDIVLSEQSLK